MPELFSAAEAAAIAEVSPEILRTALEKKSVIPSGRQRVGKALRHQFSVGDVLLVKLLAEFPFPLNRRDKEALAQIVARGDGKAADWHLKGNKLVYRSGEILMSIECKPLRQTIVRNLALLRWGKRRVSSSPDTLGGEPVFRGTRIAVEQVAALFRKGVAASVIAEDFPRLGDRYLAYARLVARLGNKPGRPRKRLAFNRSPGAGK